MMTLTAIRDLASGKQVLCTHRARPCISLKITAEQQRLFHTAQQQGYLLAFQRDHRVYDLYELYCAAVNRPLIVAHLKPTTASMEIDSIACSWQPSAAFYQSVESYWRRFASKRARISLNPTFCYCSSLPRTPLTQIATVCWHLYQRDLHRTGGQR